MELVKTKSETDGLEAFKKTVIRWGILQCLREFLSDKKVYVPYFRNLEVALSIIEAIFHKKQMNTKMIKDIDALLDGAEVKLSVKAIYSDKFPYWNNLMKRAKRGKLTRKEAVEAPFIEALIRKHDFLKYCISDEPKKKY